MGDYSNFSLKSKFFVLNLGSRTLDFGGRQHFLSNKEFGLLEYFVRNVGMVLTRTRLLEEVWDRNVFCPTNTIDVHVSVLRKKLKFFLGVDPIKTVHCVGYMFTEDF